MPATLTEPRCSPVCRTAPREHGNIKSSVITEDFVHGADYKVLAEAADTFRGLLAEGGCLESCRLWPSQRPRPDVAAS